MPYTYSKNNSGNYVVYHKNIDGTRGKKVGETGKTKEDLNKYLAALHVNEAIFDGKPHKVFKINDDTEIVCQIKKERTGFVHEATLYIDGVEKGTAKKVYANRTWERFTFASVLNKLLRQTHIVPEDKIEELLKKWESNPMNENKKNKSNKMKEVKKVTNKQKLNESILNAIMDLWNSTAQFGGEAGPGINMTVGQVFKTAVGTILGIGGLTVLNYTWNQIVSAIKSAPAKFKEIIQAAKAVKANNVEELKNMGVNLQTKSQPQLQHQEAKKTKSRAEQIKEIKTLVESIEKISGKKVVFKEAMSPVDATMIIEGGDSSEEEELKAWALLIKTGMVWQLQGFYGRTATDLIKNGVISKDGEILKNLNEAVEKFTAVKQSSPARTIENWAVANKFTKSGLASKQAASSVISSLKKDGFDIVPCPPNEKKPVSVTEAKKNIKKELKESPAYDILQLIKNNGIKPKSLNTGSSISDNVFPLPNGYSVTIGSSSVLPSATLTDKNSKVVSTDANKIYKFVQKTLEPSLTESKKKILKKIIKEDFKLQRGENGIETNVESTEDNLNQLYKVVKVFRKSDRRQILAKNKTKEEAKQIVNSSPDSQTSMVIFVKQ